PPLLRAAALLVRFKSPLLGIRPPSALLVLPLIVLLVRVNVPLLKIPPPLPAALPLTMLPVSVNVPLLRMPPPLTALLPPEMVSPLIVTVCPLLIVKTEKLPAALLRWIVSVLALGPLIRRLPLIASSALFKTITLFGGKLKLMVSSPGAAFASWIAARSVH